ncbi:EKC/KEOPS complex subunit TPRKB isoform 2-T2 [Spinachia spinachia]
MHSTHDLELFPQYNVTQMLFKDVRNAAELRQCAVEGKIKGGLINPTMLVNPFQVLVAANKAVSLQKMGKMKTRSLFSEIIFNLSPTNNISEAFKRFGSSDGDDSVLVVLVQDKDEPQLLSDITARVSGRQLYKITPQEEKCGTLLDAVVCRMATKDVM